jgi:signal transduction histidine kinase/ActR/RegA family two-component response regulator/HPt (histidine-containing phosphotransfer) domain-containing protein
VLLALLINAYQEETGRAQRVADHARLAAASVDLRLGELLELTGFCASAPALTERVDFASVAENCGRYASRIGAWVVLIETGETHRQILNTRPDAPAALPSYPRAEERETLLALEAETRRTGAPGIADVFAGIIYPGGVVSTGQHVRLADGRSAMLYVSISAQALSEQLAGLAAEGGPIFALVDPSERVVARSVGIEQAMFAAAPDWLLPLMATGAAGAALAVPGPEVIGGTWDAGYHPLGTVPGWMAAAVQPTPVGARLWAPLSVPSAMTLFGILLSGLLLWVMADRDRAARRVAEAEHRNREKSRLLASFAHDIRSPLISLIGSLELIGEGRVPSNGQVRSARGSAEALLQLVDDILELSFLGSGELTLHPSPVDLRQMTTALSDLMRPLAARKGLELRLDLDPGLPVTVEADRLRVQQVLSNLLTNAVKYTEKGSVTLRICQEGVRAGRVTLDLAVIDTGIGVAPGDVPRILREFGRLEREAERREQGTGLGLAIVQRILTAMGSSLSVESAPGQGSTFRFRLTLPVATAEDAVDAVRPLTGVVILYAEDEPVIREVTARRLEEAGATVICAEDGEDAFLQLAAMNPELLLIDLQMPGLDGVGLIRRLKEIAPGRTYPLFVLTSHISGPKAAEARAAGADAVFTKPVQVAALAAAFRARRGDGGRSTPPVRQAAGATEPPLLDPDTFREATGIMGPARGSTLVGDFEATMRADLSALEAAIDTADFKRVGELAHRCLGLCLVMGAVALVQRLREMEMAAGEGNTAALPGLARRVVACFEATSREMRSTLQYGATDRSQ